MLPEYEFYTETYYGNQITEADFPRLISRASAYLNVICNIDNVPEKDMKLAICAVAEAWQINEQGGDVVSQSVGSWSKTFAGGKPKTNEERLNDAAQLYLKKYCNMTVRWV